LTTFFHIKPDGLLAVQHINTRGQNGAENNGETRTTASTPRYLITLKSVWDAQFIYSQRLQKLKNQNVFISEDLNPSESNIFYKARQLKKAGIVHTVWTKDGKTYFRKEYGQEALEFYPGHPILQTKNINEKSSIQEYSTLQPTQQQESPPLSQQEPSTRPTPILLSTAILSSSSFTHENNKEIFHPALQDTSLSPSSANLEKQQEDSEEDEIKQLMDSALQGALTRAVTKKKKKKTSKE
jgi:hypothetical protein